MPVTDSSMRQLVGKVRHRLAAKLLDLSPVDLTERLAPRAIGSLPAEDLVSLLYPDVDDRSELTARAVAAIGGPDVTATSDIRRILGGIDRQTYASPATVRFRADDVVEQQVGESGLTIVLDRADGSVSAFLLQGQPYEPHVSAVIGDVCKPGMTVVDVGANIGYETLLFARAVGPAGHVLAIEPNSENCRLILASVAANGFDNVDLAPVALDGADGWSYFSAYVGSNGGFQSTGHREYVEGGGSIVPTRRLDDLCPGEVDLLKIDVEGGEGRVIAGASGLFERCRPIVISEFSCEMLRRISAVEPLDYLAFYADRDYSLNVIERGGEGRVAPYTSPKALLDTWDDEYRIEDLLLLPG